MFRAAPPEASPPEPRRRSREGFTLLEVLVALAVASIVLAAVGALAGANARAARRVAERVALIETARAVEAGIPPGRALKIGHIDGAVAGHRWRMDIRPLDTTAEADTAWVPVSVLIRVRAPSGATMVLETVRLARSGEE